jgi:peptide/nickel transport system permease protein
VSSDAAAPSTLSRGNWLRRTTSALSLSSARLNLRLGAIIVLGWLLVALLAPWIAPYDPIAHDLPDKLQGPNFAHPFGTDNFGRDILSRVMHGARIDMQMGVIGVFFPFLIGTVIGSIAGYAGRWVDALLMRIVDVVLAFPFLVLLMAIIAILKPGLISFFVALALVGWVSYARLVRAQVLVLKTSDFVIAARSLGFGHMRILFRHILPNCIAGSIVFSMSDVVLTVLAGSSISYLGLGVQPPTAEWGVMIAEGQNFLTTAWWMATFPGLAIVLLAFGFSLLADGLAERFGLREQ